MMMTSAPISPSLSPASVGVAAKKTSHVRSGAELAAVAAPNAGLYAPVAATPTMGVVVAPNLADMYTPTIGTPTPALGANGLPADPTNALSTTDAPLPPAKGGLDPIAGAVGVVGLGALALLLPFAFGEKDKHWVNAGKVFLGAGLGVGAAILAPMGGNLIKDLMKKKTDKVTPPADQDPAAVVVGTPQVMSSTMQAMPDGSSVPPAVDPMTGLPVVVAQQSVSSPVAYAPTLSV
jgi:hypothetical protein